MVERLLLGFKGALEDINVIVSPASSDEFVALYVLLNHLSYFSVTI